MNNELSAEEVFEVNAFNTESNETEFDYKALGYMIFVLKAGEFEVRDGVEGINTQFEIALNGLSDIEIATGVYGALQMFPEAFEELKDLIADATDIKVTKKGQDDE